MILTLAATSIVGFMSLDASAGKHGPDYLDVARKDKSPGGDLYGKQHAPDEQEHKDGENGKPKIPGGGGDGGKNTPPAGMGGDNVNHGDGGSNGAGGPYGGGRGQTFNFRYNNAYRGVACYTGYGVVIVRDIRDCRTQGQRRVVINGGRKQNYGYAGGYAYGGGYQFGSGGYAYGGGYATGGGFGYAYPQPNIRYYTSPSRAAVMQAQKRARRAAQSYGAGYGYEYSGYGYSYPQPIVRYYKPASRAAVMQVQKRARRAAQNYGAGYGYDNGGYAGGGYGSSLGVTYDNGGYAPGYGDATTGGTVSYNGGAAYGYGVQAGYGQGMANGYVHRRLKRGMRPHGAPGYGYGFNNGYGLNTGFGDGFGYDGIDVHYGPVMTKDGAY